MRENPALPLTGLLVVELGHSVAAPYAGLVLAELGAEVVKVERPGQGDDARRWGPPFHEGTATVFKALNRNKRSVVADLRAPEDLAAVKTLVARADVLVQNLRPGQAAAVGLGAAAMLEANPRLVYASIGAFGAAGPLRAEPGYDPLMQAFGGLMSVTGEAGRPPVRVGTSPIDMGAGMWVVTGVLAALLRRATTGRGGEVATSLYETALGWMLYHVAAQAATGEEPGRFGSGTAMIAPYQAFPTADGDLVVAAGNDGLFRRLCGVIGQPGLADEPRYATNADRVRHRAALTEILGEALRSRSRAEWMVALAAAGVPCAPVQEVGELVVHPQTRALGILRGEGVPGGIRTIGLPLAFDGHRPARDTAAPALGEATEAYLAASAPAK